MSESFSHRWYCLACLGWRPRAGFGMSGGLFCCRACIVKREPQ